MNIRLQMRILGFALLCISLVILGPMVVDFIYHGNDTRAWIFCALLPMIIACFLIFYSRKCCSTMYPRDAVSIVLLIWVGVILLGALPYLLITPTNSFYDAFFESVSGYTSTGLSVFSNIEQLPKSVLLYRSLTEWVGGLGIIVLLTFLLPSGVYAKKLYDNETSVLDGELSAYSVKHMSYRISVIYVILTTCCALSYYSFDMSPFDAICHAFTTVSTGGLSNYNDGFMHFQSVGIKYTAIIFMIIGGTNFQIISSIFLFRRVVLKKNDEFRTYLVVLGVICAIVLILNRHTLGSVDGVFQAVSTITTTGFSVSDRPMVPATYVLLLAAMLIGGCTGSTAGGVKIARLVIIFKSIKQQVEHLARPRLVRTLRINNNVLDQDTLLSHISLFCLHVTLIATTVFLIAIFQPSLSMSGITSISIASISNAGVMFVPHSLSDISTLHVPTKAILSILMLLGRLEICPILCLFLRSFWEKYRN